MPKTLYQVDADEGRAAQSYGLMRSTYERILTLDAAAEHVSELVRKALAAPPATEAV